ncbi:MAG: hypothetical protein WBW33_14665, partial [Bryobacteraceae bacterium]
VRILGTWPPIATITDDNAVYRAKPRGDDSSDDPRANRDLHRDDSSSNAAFGFESRSRISRPRF